MKKLFLLVSVTVVFTACQQKEPERYTSSSPEIDAVKAHVTAYNEGNWSAWTAIYADTAKVYHNALTAASPKEVSEGLKSNLEAASSYSLGGDDPFYEMVIANDGEKWVNSWVTWQGSLAANGKELTIPVHATYQFVGDKVVEEYAYYNLSEFMAMVQQVEAENNMSADEKTIKTTIDNVTKAWNSFDKDLMDSNLTNNFKRTENGNVIAKNPKEYSAFMAIYHGAFPDFTVKIDKTIIDGNTAYLKWTCTGTNTGSFMENPPTNKKIKTHGFSIWRFDTSGKGIQEDAFYDNLIVFNQLGIAPPKQ